MGFRLISALSYSSTFLTTLAGTPVAIVQAGIFLVTKDLSILLVFSCVLNGFSLSLYTIFNENRERYPLFSRKIERNKQKFTNMLNRIFQLSNETITLPVINQMKSIKQTECL